MSYAPSGPPESQHRDIWVSGKVGDSRARCLATSLHQKGYEVTLVEVNKSSEQPLASWGEVSLEKTKKARPTLGGVDTIKKARA
eukprot:Skav210310  [mRNA]  locus=scaffold475:232849:233421:- [translate_table: standard]